MGSATIPASKLTLAIIAAKSAVGAPYAFWPAPAGFEKWTAEEVKRNGLSCSEFLDWAFAQAGAYPGHWGTYAYRDHISNRSTFDPNKEYPIGTILVTDSGPEGHVAMVIGKDNQLIQSALGIGVTSGLTAKEQAKYVTYKWAGSVPGIGTSTSLPQAADKAAEAVTGAAMDIAQGVASGIARGLIMVLKYMYGKAVLQPWDFAVGFWWELTKHFFEGFGNGTSGKEEDKAAMQDTSDWQT